MGIEREIDKFWNRDSLGELKEIISSPEHWEEEIPKHLSCLFGKDSGLETYLHTNRKDMSVLEIGCGIGRLMKPLASFFKDVSGIDISERMLDEAKSYMAGVPNYKTHYVGHDGNFPVDDASMHLVYSIIVFQHIHTKETIHKYFKETYRALKPGGWFRVQTHRGLPGPTGKFCGFAGYMYPDLKAFKKDISSAGFIVKKSSDGFGHKEWLWVTAQKPV